MMPAKVQKKAVRPVPIKRIKAKEVDLKVDFDKFKIKPTPIMTKKELIDLSRLLRGEM